VLAALVDIQVALPFPLLGVDSDNGSEFINWHLLRWCEKQKLTFTRSRPGNSNDGAHVECKNWAVVRTIVGYLRYDTTPELVLLNKIWVLQSLMTNFFYPQQKLVSKVREGAKVKKTYDRPRTPMVRADGPPGGHRRVRGRPGRAVRRPEPGRDRATDSGPVRAAVDRRHQQGRRRPKARPAAGIG